MDEAEKFRSKNPGTQLVPYKEIRRELRENKRTRRDQLEMTLVPLNTEGWTDANLTYTLMRAAIDEHTRNKWYVVVVNINACDDETNKCPNIARTVYIPDRKGYDGRSSSEKWTQLSVYLQMLREMRGHDFFDND